MARIISRDSVSDIVFHGPLEEPYTGMGARYISVSIHHPRRGQIGFIAAQPFNTSGHYDPLADYRDKWGILCNDTDDCLTPRHYRDFVAVRDKIGIKNLQGYNVTDARVERCFRGQGVGQAMYLRLMQFAAKEKNAVLIPEFARCWFYGTGGSVENQKDIEQGTKEWQVSDSGRAWNALKKAPGVISSGLIFWGGEVQIPKLQPKRGHGFAKTNRPRMKVDIHEHV
jgi:GNAT superfamily N-acetyltransferase